MKKLALSLGVLTLLPLHQVRAQDLSLLQQEIDTLKEDVIVLNRKVYRDKADSAVSITSGGTANLGEYDEIIRNLNGKVEELEFKVKQIDERITTLNKDIDTRFKLLEGKPITAGTGTFETPQKHAPIVAKGAPKSIVGDKITSGSLKDLGSNNPSSVDQLYKTGLESLKAGDLIVAEQNFQLILDQYPSDNLASNAQYWLGEVYYKDQNYQKAAVAFGKGYENYKNGNKGADSLYKLGVTMAQMNKKTEACAALKNLGSEFPSADSDLKNKAKAYASKLGCK